MTKSLATALLITALLIAFIPGCLLAHGPWISPIGLADAPAPSIDSPNYGPWISPIGLAETPEPRIDSPAYGPWISPIGLTR